MGFSLGNLLGPIGNTFANAKAAKDAGRAQQEANVNAYKDAVAAKQQSIDYLSPFIQGGTQAFNRYSQLVNNPSQSFDFLKSSPLYQFQRQEGENALKNYLSAQGLSQSGAGGKSIVDYNQQYANTAINDYLSQLAGLANAGQSSASNAGNVLQGFAQLGGGYLTGAGEARAAGILGQQQAYNQGLNNLTSLGTRMATGGFLG